MNAASDYLELRCGQCGFCAVCDVSEMLRWLHSVGMLRREKKPPVDLIEELFLSTAGRFACPQCSAVGLSAGPPQEDEADWDQSPPCEACGKPIPPERLEVFPDTRLCAACKQTDEQQGPVEEPEYCPHCGAVMTLQKSRGAGISRYVMTCPECR